MNKPKEETVAYKRYMPGYKTFVSHLNAAIKGRKPFHIYSEAKEAKIVTHNNGSKAMRHMLVDRLKWIRPTIKDNVYEVTSEFAAAHTLSDRFPTKTVAEELFDECIAYHKEYMKSNKQAKKMLQPKPVAVTLNEVFTPAERKTLIKAIEIIQRHTK